MKFNWTDQRIAQLKAMVSDGGTAGSIAVEWGVSRSTVAGEMNRLGLKRDRPAPEPKPINPRIRHHKKNRPIGPVMPVAAPPPPPEPLPPPLFHPGQVELDNPVLALTGTSCRFPIGDPRRADFRFCCAPKLGISPYCELHHVIAYAGRTAAEAKAGKSEVAAT